RGPAALEDKRRRAVRVTNRCRSGIPFRRIWRLSCHNGVRRRGRPRRRARVTEIMWLYLFDIDGTLVHSGGAGRRAIEVAFAAVWDRTVPPEGYARIRFNGRTDLAILRDVGAIAGLTASAYGARESELLDAYLAALPGEMARAERRRIYPGVTALLEALS